MASNIDLSQAHAQFVGYLQNRKRAHATIVAYKKDIDQLLQYLRDMGKKSINEVNKDEITSFLTKLTKDNYTPKSISRKINSIKTFYRFLKSQNYVDEDQTKNIVHPKYDIKPPRILSKIEYRALRDACREDARISAIVELFLQTGLRIGELANLTVDNVKDHELFVKAQESHSERTIPLNKAAKFSIDKYLTIRPKCPNNALFVTKTGRSLLIRNIRTAIDRFFKLAGIENAKVNDLRHTFIAHHLISGTPLNVISKLVGHKRLSTTEKYLEFVKGKIEKSVKLEEL